MHFTNCSLVHMNCLVIWEKRPWKQKVSSCGYEAICFHKAPGPPGMSTHVEEKSFPAFCLPRKDPGLILSYVCKQVNSNLLLAFSSAGGSAGRTYMSSTSFLLTLERLGRGSLLGSRKEMCVTFRPKPWHYNDSRRRAEVFLFCWCHWRIGG